MGGELVHAKPRRTPETQAAAPQVLTQFFRPQMSAAGVGNAVVSYDQKSEAQRKRKAMPHNLAAAFQHLLSKAQLVDNYPYLPGSGKQFLLYLIFPIARPESCSPFPDLENGDSKISNSKPRAPRNSPAHRCFAKRIPPHRSSQPLEV